MDHVKSFDAYKFIKYLVFDIGQILSAKWDTNKFAIHIIIETDLDKDELLDWLRDNSLEDTEYEACSDTGWIVMTRGTNMEAFTEPRTDKYKTELWEYAHTDYRYNPIEINEIY